MESSLLFFLIGLSVFFVDHFSRKERSIIRLFAFILAGLVTGGILGSFVKFPILMSVREPWIAMGMIGGLAGIILYPAAKDNWVSKPGLQYIATILLGLILAVLSYGLIKFYTVFSHSELLPQAVNTDFIFIAHLFMGFLIIFGYTFPLRWFKLKELRKEKEV